MSGRRAVLAQMLDRAVAARGTRPMGTALDFGGDRGQMLKDLPDSKKWVIDMSGTNCEPWAKRGSAATEFEGKCDFVMCCQVLEHVDDPIEIATTVSSLARIGGWIYLEVPDEQWTQRGAKFAWRRKWIEFVLYHPTLLIALDFLSTASRIVLGAIPSWGFWVMREHLNFFTEDALIKVAERAGIEKVLVARNSSGIALVGIKK